MATKTKLWHLEHFNVFKGMSEGELALVSSMADMLKMSSDEFIYFPDEPSTTIFFLKKGKIKIGVVSDSGRETIKAILSPGEVFGELSILNEEVRHEYAKAIGGEVQICVIDKDDMRKLMNKIPRMSFKITKLIGTRLRIIERRLEGLIFKNSRERIIDFLIDLAKDTGQQIGKEIMVKHSLTHLDIAHLTASSRQTVTSVLNELREKNLLYFERKKFLFRDLDKLC
ncbi:MAG: Crp/Fnr family transcriptional regulator [Flavobacteriales bacterium]|nr:Crp/Fnr family transcriptional regulator [Flavobacteriales bacterium]